MHLIGYDGISDHSDGYEIAIAAVALGAQIVEKHFTLNRNMPGLDHKASLDPVQFAEMVRCIRNVEEALKPKPMSEREHAQRDIVRQRMAFK
jgi:sialic acid synthase SpsE